MLRDCAFVLGGPWPIRRGIQRTQLISICYSRRILADEHSIPIELNSKATPFL